MRLLNAYAEANRERAPETEVEQPGPSGLHKGGSPAKAQFSSFSVFRIVGEAASSVFGRKLLTAAVRGVKRAKMKKQRKVCLVTGLVMMSELLTKTKLPVLSNDMGL